MTVTANRADMHLLCKESAMGPLRRLMQKLDLTTLESAPEDEEVGVLIYRLASGRYLVNDPYVRFARSLLEKLQRTTLRML